MGLGFRESLGLGVADCPKNGKPTGKDSGKSNGTSTQHTHFLNLSSYRLEFMLGTPRYFNTLIL